MIIFVRALECVNKYTETSLDINPACVFLWCAVNGNGVSEMQKSCTRPSEHRSDVDAFFVFLFFNHTYRHTCAHKPSENLFRYAF